MTETVFPPEPGRNGYKAFDKWLVAGKRVGHPIQFTVGMEYVMQDEPLVARRGFHFCPYLYQVYIYYPLLLTTRVCLVEALGAISVGQQVRATNHIKIIKELSRGDILDQLEQEARYVTYGPAAAQCLSVLQQELHMGEQSYFTITPGS